MKHTKMRNLIHQIQGRMEPGSLDGLRKEGFNATYEECEAYCNSLGMDLKEFVKEMGPDHIIMGRTSGGTVITKVIDRRWASVWARNYGYDLPITAT